MNTQKIRNTFTGIFCALLMLGIGLPMLHIGWYYGFVFNYHGQSLDGDTEMFAGGGWIPALIFGGISTWYGLQTVWLVLRGKYPAST